MKFLSLCVIINEYILWALPIQQFALLKKDETELLFSLLKLSCLLKSDFDISKMALLANTIYSQSQGPKKWSSPTDFTPSLRHILITRTQNLDKQLHLFYSSYSLIVSKHYTAPLKRKRLLYRSSIACTRGRQASNTTTFAISRHQMAQHNIFLNPLFAERISRDSKYWRMLLLYHFLTLCNTSPRGIGIYPLYFYRYFHAKGSFK